MRGAFGGKIWNVSALALLTSLVFAAPASAEKRIALVIGNSAYQNVARLDNPRNDAASMADTLASLGFTLVGGHAQLIEPLDVAGWRDALRRVADDEDWWHCLRSGVVEHARGFTWEQCAADTLGVYRKLCGEEAPGSQPLRVAG